MSCNEQENLSDIIQCNEIFSSTDPASPNGVESRNNHYRENKSLRSPTSEEKEVINGYEASSPNSRTLEEIEIFNPYELNCQNVSIVKEENFTEATQSEVNNSSINSISLESSLINSGNDIKIEKGIQFIKCPNNNLQKSTISMDTKPCVNNFLPKNPLQLPDDDVVFLEEIKPSRDLNSKDIIEISSDDEE